MILYHFTCRAWWHFIQTEGITKGEAPITWTKTENHPNLTSNPDPFSQLWQGQFGIRKNTVRISVNISENDPNLISWRDFAKSRGMDRNIYRQLDEAGGWEARNWWVYLAFLPPDRFLAVDFFDDGRMTPKESTLLATAQESSSSEEVKRKLGAISVDEAMDLIKRASP